MAIPDREWYSINGAAKFLEISEEDIEYYLVTGKLIASIKLLHTNKYLYEFKTYEEILDEIETDLDSDYVKFMLEQYDDYLKYVESTGDKETKFNEFEALPELDETQELYIETDENYINIYCGIYNINRYDLIEWNNDICDLKESKIRVTKIDNNNPGHFHVCFASKIVNKNQIIILKDTMVRFKTLYQIHESQSEKAPLYQTKRPWEEDNSDFFSEELATAVQVWERVFGHKPDKPKSNSFKEDIESILDLRRDLKGAAKERLGILLNPDKFKPGGRQKKNNY